MAVNRNNNVYGTTGNTGSSYGVYGSNYGGASTTTRVPTTKSASTPTTSTYVHSNQVKYPGQSVNTPRGYADNATGSYGDTMTLTKKNGITQYKNNITGTERYGYNTPDSVYYPGGATNQNNLRNTYNYSGSSSGGSGGSGSGSVDGSGEWNAGGRQGQDDTLDKIKELLSEQEKKANDYYKTLYEQQIAQNKQGFENNRNQINLNYKRGERYINNQYGNGISGAGLTNRIRNNSNWINNLTSNRQNYENNDATALASYNNNRANSASTLAQGWYNYVMPIYTNRQQSDDDYSYRRFLAQNGWL